MDFISQLPLNDVCKFRLRKALYQKYIDENNYNLKIQDKEDFESTYDGIAIKYKDVKYIPEIIINTLQEHNKNNEDEDKVCLAGSRTVYSSLAPEKLYKSNDYDLFIKKEQCEEQCEVVINSNKNLCDIFLYMNREDKYFTPLNYYNCNLYFDKLGIKVLGNSSRYNINNIYIIDVFISIYDIINNYNILIIVEKLRTKLYTSPLWCPYKYFYINYIYMKTLISIINLFTNFNIKKYKISDLIDIIKDCCVKSCPEYYTEDRINIKKNTIQQTNISNHYNTENFIDCKFIDKEHYIRNGGVSINHSSITVDYYDDYFMDNDTNYHIQLIECNNTINEKCIYKYIENHFDLSICKIAYNGYKLRFLTNIINLFNKQIEIRPQGNHKNLIERLKKYIKQNNFFTISEYSAYPIELKREVAKLFA